MIEITEEEYFDSIYHLERSTKISLLKSFQHEEQRNWLLEHSVPDELDTPKDIAITAFIDKLNRVLPELRPCWYL